MMEKTNEGIVEEINNFQNDFIKFPSTRAEINKRIEGFYYKVLFLNMHLG